MPSSSSFMKTALVVALCTLACFAWHAGAQSVCSATINGKQYNINPLASFPQEYEVSSSFYKMMYRPCAITPCYSYPNMAVCQQITGSSAAFPAGEFTSAVWRASTRADNPEGFQILFSAMLGSNKITTTLEFICDRSFESIGRMGPGPNGVEPTTNQFFLDWRTIHACPVNSGGGGGGGGSGGGGGGGDDGGLAGGWIFIIVLGSLMIVYVVAGFAFNKWYRHEEGLRNQLPHFEFWSSLPGLVKDGCVFTYTKARGLVSSSSSSSSYSSY